MTESTNNTGASTARWAMGIAIVSAFLAFGSFMSRPEPKSAMRSQLSEASKMKIHGEGTLNIGYIGTSGFVMENNQRGEKDTPVAGLCVDLMNEIANRANPNIKIKWVNTTKDTLAQDLLNGTIDMVADPVFIDVNRSSSCGFTIPLCYIGVAHAVVRANDNRIKNFSDLNNSDLKISVVQGTPSSNFAQTHLDKPKFFETHATGAGTNAKMQVDDVVQGRSDVALLEGNVAIEEVLELDGKVKALWIESPPSMVPAGFATRLDDLYLRDFLNTCLLDLEAEGLISGLELNWQTMAYYKNLDLNPGSGITSLIGPPVQSSGAAPKNAAKSAKQPTSSEQAPPPSPKPYELGDKK